MKHSTRRSSRQSSRKGCRNASARKGRGCQRRPCEASIAKLTGRYSFGLARGVVVLWAQFGPRAERESGATPSRADEGYAGAAPATVSGELRSRRVTDAERHREGQTTALTCAPGDLPRSLYVLGRAAPVGRVQWIAMAILISCMRSAWPMPPTKMEYADVPIFSISRWIRFVTRNRPPDGVRT
jgi:hypothetical protein